jgi:hypothetical protein
MAIPKMPHHGLVRLENPVSTGFFRRRIPLEMPALISALAGTVLPSAGT